MLSFEKKFVLTKSTEIFILLIEEEEHFLVIAVAKNYRSKI